METHYLYSMPIKTKTPTDNGHFFITFTCFNWLPLIETTNGYDLVCNYSSAKFYRVESKAFILC